MCNSAMFKQKRKKLIRIDIRTIIKNKIFTPKKSYSQQGEDIIIENALKILGIRVGRDF